MSADDDRHSRADEPELVRDENRRAELEARNQLVQFDEVVERIRFWTESGRPFRLRPSMILDLNRTALDGVSKFAGGFRPAGIEIGGSRHTPPPAAAAPGLLEDMCDYVNDHWEEARAVHLAAFVLWRLNWIHPFVDGNGRTSRALAYLLLCVKLGYQLPGRNTVPEQIASDKTPYYRALEAADVAYQGDEHVDVSELEDLLATLLAKQLDGVYRHATGSAGLGDENS